MNSMNKVPIGSIWELNYGWVRILYHKTDEKKIFYKVIKVKHARRAGRLNLIRNCYNVYWWNSHAKPACTLLRFK